MARERGGSGAAGVGAAREDDLARGGVRVVCGQASLSGAYEVLLLLLSALFLMF